MFDEGMAFSRNLSGQDGRTLGRFLAHEEVAVVELDVLDAMESPHKVEVPVGAAEFAVGEERQACSLFFFNQLRDAFVLDGFERSIVDSADSVLGASVLKACGSKKAADDIIVAGGGLGHGGSSHRMCGGMFDAEEYDVCARNWEIQENRHIP